MTPDITLVITNWNGSELLRECLPSVIRATKFDSDHVYEIMVIDDCSTDNSLDVLKNEFPIVRREKTPHNLGFQGANNYGVQLANSSVVMPMNNDMKLDQKALYYLARHFDNKGMFAVSGKIFDFDNSANGNTSDNNVKSRLAPRIIKIFIYRVVLFFFLCFISLLLLY